MRNYADSLNEDALLTAFKTLPKPFNGEDEDNVKKYASFFQRYDTHIITKVQSYGAHYQLASCRPVSETVSLMSLPLHIWAPNTNSSVNDAWPNDVKVDYDGILSSGEFDPSVRNTAQYKDYLLKQKLESVFGGDNNAAQQPLAVWQSRSSRSDDCEDRCRRQHKDRSGPPPSLDETDI
ncbi:hypothetical protein E1B28_010820 [Marasmius oreades]|uniref:MACPF domain-containing protein n=1 Tax=Marasmius oreades TaxID=181124 RepID=A0A9P7RSR5_9AGAR|nr:uncharacterized protein E1B28_010820 [Marasmius oreades]KAG7089111.1 hypothetical protein E1B28_010820 [Marasmius oreades]